MASQQDQQEILQLEDFRFKAMVLGDLLALDKVLSEDLTYTHTSGVLDSKAQLIASLESGQRHYESITPQDVQVRVYGSVGVVTGVSLMRTKGRGRNEASSFRIRFLDVYVKKLDLWQLVAWQSTRLP